MKEIVKEKKELKKSVNRISWGVIWIISVLLSLTALSGYLFIQLPRMIIVENANEAEMEQMFNQVLSNDNILGFLSIVGVLSGVSFLFLYFRKSVEIRKIFEVNKKITGKAS